MNQESAEASIAPVIQHPGEVCYKLCHMYSSLIVINLSINGITYLFVWMYSDVWL